MRMLMEAAADTLDNRRGTSVLVAPAVPLTTTLADRGGMAMAIQQCKSPARAYAVYGLYDPRTDAMRYIGMTADPRRRARDHVASCKRECNRKSKWIRGLVAIGLKPTMRVLEWCADLESVASAERRHIEEANALCHRLTNAVEGRAALHQASPRMRVSMSEAAKRSPAARAHLKEMTEACKKPVIDHEGRAYSSIAAAAAEMGTTPTNIARVVQGRGVTVKGMGFRFLHDPNPLWRTSEEWERYVSSRREQKAANARRRGAVNIGRKRSPAAILATANATRRRMADPAYKERLRNSPRFIEGHKKRAAKMRGRRRERAAVRASAASHHVPLIDQFGTVYESGVAAAIAIGVYTGSVSSVVNGRRQQIKGFTFKRVSQAGELAMAASHQQAKEVQRR